MVLDTKTIEKIKSLVYQRPRNINELANALGKNWRTVNRYVEEIMLKTGTIKTLTFREGTRGALKIVYWNNTEKIYSTDIQEKLFKRIELGVEKSDFSPFEIFQYVDSDKREAYYETFTNEEKYTYDMDSLIPFFKSAEKEICIFAGNAAFTHFFIKELKECIKRKIMIKIITNLNFVDLTNVELLLSLNSGLKEPLIEVRHEITPLRAYIFDDSIARLGELSFGQKKGQSKKKFAIYYEIRDETWVEWLKKLFWKKFQNAIPSSNRIDNLSTIKKH